MMWYFRHPIVALADIGLWPDSVGVMRRYFAKQDRHRN